MAFEFDLGPAIDALPLDTLQHLRPEGGARVRGLRVNPTYRQLADFSANVQPTTAKEIKFIPGGEEASGLITIRIVGLLDRLRVDSVDEVGADHVRWKDVRYKILSVGAWDTYGFGTYIAGPVAEKVES